MHRLIVCGLVCLVAFGGITAEQEHETQHEDHNLDSQIQELQKNLTEVWNYIFQFKNGMTAQVRHLEKHQLQLLYAVSHLSHHTGSQGDHSHDHHHGSSSHESHKDDDHHHGGSSHESHKDDDHHKKIDCQHGNEDHHDGSSHVDDHHHCDSSHDSHDESSHDDHHKNDDGHHGSDQHHHDDDHHHDNPTETSHDDHHHDDHKETSHDNHHHDDHKETSHDDHHHDDDDHHSHSSSSDSHHGHDDKDPNKNDSNHGADDHHHGGTGDHHEHKDDHDTQQVQVAEKVVAAVHRHHTGHGQSHHDHRHVHHHDHQSAPDNRTVFPGVRDYQKYLFATCNVDRNRAIDVQTQHDLQGEVTFFQKKTGGPLGIHFRVSGFKMDDHQHGQQIAMDHHAMSLENDQPAGHLHGLHVHTSGDTSNSCDSMGPHYNPTHVAHGGPTAHERHVGDFGNIECDEHGNSNLLFSDPIASLTGEFSIFNRGLVIHANEDDYGLHPDDPESLKTGNSGGRIGCCVIKEVQRPSFKAARYSRRAKQYHAR